MPRPWRRLIAQKYDGSPHADQDDREGGKRWKRWWCECRKRTGLGGIGAFSALYLRSVVYLVRKNLGRMSINTMPKDSSDRIDLLQGTLDMLILSTLLFGSAHEHQIAKHIARTTEDVLQVEHGSLYPALHRLERKGWLAAKWEPAGQDLQREFKYYRLTPVGKKSRSNRRTASPLMRRIMPLGGHSVIQQW
jgi:PadR family transcriptional regulator, regulatory protein PadR